MSERGISMQTFTLQKSGAFLALTMAGFLTGCAHAPATPELDRSSGLNMAPIAERFRVARCQVPSTIEKGMRLFEQACSWIVLSGPRLKIPNHARHRSVLRHRHHRWQRHTLLAGFSDKPRPQAMGTKISF